MSWTFPSLGCGYVSGTSSVFRLGMVLGRRWISFGSLVLFYSGVNFGVILDCLCGPLLSLSLGGRVSFSFWSERDEIDGGN